ncbi:MAG TPA: hypothetical protein PKA63_12615 [Oligoflexia bacterium]|nr:hypothetical protein [Oligoflexia bacterium]
MKKNYHRDYEILASLFEEHIQGEKEKKIPFQRPVNDQYELKEPTNGLIWMIVVILIIIASTVLFYFFYGNSSTVNSSPSAAVLDKIDRPTEESKRDLAGEIDLIKGVLDDLVQSVESISKHSQPIVEKEIVINKFDQVFPVKVTTLSANLRQNPKKDAVTISTVQKDTLLVALGEYEDWILTFAPTGEEAWVHSSIITKVGGK